MPQCEKACNYTAVTSHPHTSEAHDECAHTQVDDVSSVPLKWVCDKDWLTSLVCGWLLSCCFPTAIPEAEVDDIKPEVDDVVVTEAASMSFDLLSARML